MQEDPNAAKQPLRPKFLAVSLLVVLLLLLVIVPQTIPSNVKSHFWSGPRIVFIKPIFTATAYSSYYTFYGKYANTPRTQVITSDLNLLNVTIVDGWGWSTGIQRFLDTNAKDYGLVVGENVALLTDISVTLGALFHQNGSNRFETVVVGFTEYVTIQEYNAYQRFVAHGGRLVLMDATNFLAEVRYYQQTNHLALVKGHGWSFDGHQAQPDVFHRWRLENRNWVGSNFCCSTRHYNGANLTSDHPICKALRQKFGHKVFTAYVGHEENSLENATATTLLAIWLDTSPTPGLTVATYLHHYGNGTVVHFGAMGSDIISRDPTVHYFLYNSLQETANQTNLTGSQNPTILPVTIPSQVLSLTETRSTPLNKARPSPKIIE